MSDAQAAPEPAQQPASGEVAVPVPVPGRVAEPRTGAVPDLADAPAPADAAAEAHAALPRGAAPGPTDLSEPLLASLRQWHNRMPWARRLAPAEITGVGLVKLAFSDDAAARPLYRPQTLVPGISAARLGRFARRHGYDESPGPADWPVRELAPEPWHAGQAVRWRYLMTAAIPPTRGERVLRVLAGRVKGAKTMPFAGQRALSLRRLGIILASAGLILALVGGAWAWRGHAGPVRPGALPAASAPASLAAVATVAASAHDVAEPASSAASVEAAVASASLAEPEAQASAASAPALPASVLPRPASAPAGPLENLSVPGAPTLASDAASAPPPPPPPRYALVSLPQADPDGAAGQALKRHVSQSLSLRAQDRHLEWMPSPQGQVLTLWPYESKAQAERVARKLQRQGLNLQVVAF